MAAGVGGGQKNPRETGEVLQFDMFGWAKKKVWNSGGFEPIGNSLQIIKTFLKIPSMNFNKISKNQRTLEFGLCEYMQPIPEFG